jgi:hypothetical protein
MRRSTPERPASGERGSRPAAVVRRQHFSVNAGETPGGPPLTGVASVSYPGVGTEAWITPVSGLRPGSRGSPPRRQPPGLVTAGSHDLLPNLPGVWPVHVRSLQSLPGRRWRRCPSAGTPYWVQVDLLGVFDRGPRLWVRPGGPRHSVGRGYRARPVVPALLRAADLTACPGWWHSRRRGGRLSGPRGARGQRGAGRVRLGQRGSTCKPTRQTPANGRVRARSGLLLSPRIGAGTPDEYAGGSGWFFNRNQKITPRGRPE